MSFYVSTTQIPASSSFPIALNPSVIFQPQRNRSNPDLLVALKRDKYEEDDNHAKKPKKADGRYRKKERRPTTSRTSLDIFTSMSTAASQVQPPNGFFTHRPSMTGFDSLSTVTSLVSPQSMSLQYKDTQWTEPERRDTRLNNGEAVPVRSALDTSSGSHFQPLLSVKKDAMYSSRELKRHSLPIIHPIPSNQFAYTTSRPPSPTFEFPPVPSMPSEDVNMPLRQRILEETIGVNKEFLKKWEQESQQHVKSILLNNILERNKFINHLTNDIRERLNPRTSVWPETQYPLCIDITDDDEDQNDCLP